MESTRRGNIYKINTDATFPAKEVNGLRYCGNRYSGSDKVPNGGPEFIYEFVTGDMPRLLFLWR